MFVVSKSGVGNGARQKYTCKAACNLWLTNRIYFILFYQAVSANSLCIIDEIRSITEPILYLVCRPPFATGAENIGNQLELQRQQTQRSPEIIPFVAPRTVRRKFSEANGKPFGA